MSNHSTNEVRFINPPELENPPGYSHVADVRGSRLIFLAGQAALDVDGEREVPIWKLRPTAPSRMFL